MIEVEEENQASKVELSVKDKLIAKLEKRITTLDQGLKSGDKMTAQNLDGMANLDAKLAFITNEKNEMQEELEYVKSSKNTQI